MSKSTRRNGPVVMHARLTIDANPKPSNRLLKQWARLDSAATKEFGKRYDKLTDKQKTELHFKQAVKREQARNRQASKDLELDAREDNNG